MDQHQPLTGLAQELARRITETPLSTEPFTFLDLKDVFPEASYRSIVDHLPETRYFRQYKHPDARLPDGNSARLKLDVTPEGVVHLPRELRAFWTEMHGVITSEAFTWALKEQFRDVLEAQTGKKIEDLKIHPRGTLFRDIAGYKIAIHPDSPNKAITVGLYFPKDESQAHMGTKFHGRTETGEFYEAKQMSFTPRRGYAFAVTPHSYHSVSQLDENAGERTSLLILFYHDRGRIIESLKWLQRKLTALHSLITSL